VRPSRREDRAPTYRQLVKTLTEDAAAVWVAHPQSFIVRRAFLNGFPVTPLLGSYAPDLSGLSSGR
jgi:ABC-type transport system substrate-binding protein